MLVVFVLTALFATAAFAEATLLASWLLNGVSVIELLSVEMHAPITLEDTKTIAGVASVLCTITADGSVGGNGEAETTEILNALGEKIGTALSGLALLGTGAGSGEGSECKTVKACAEGTSTSPIEVTVLGLPWHSLLFQHETTGIFLLLLFTEGELGYELLCLVLGINAEDKCTSATKDFEIEVLNEEEDAAIPANAQTEPVAKCSLSGEATGHNLVDELTLIKPLEGLLTISAEGGGGDAESTTLTTTLSGEGKEGETITVLEGSKVKDKATLKGKNASTATGKVVYKVYSDSECKTSVVTAGEVTVSGESVPASSEEELTAGASYYWQAHYSGDSKNAESTSTCSEISSVKAKTTLSDKLSGEGKEGEEITIHDGAKAEDTATLSGTNSSTAGGKVLYKVYSDNKCEHLVTEAGEVTVSSGTVPPSSEEELEGETNYWRAHYGGDSLHQESESTCGKAVLKVIPLACVKPYCETTIAPGVRVSLDEECTAGPIMTKGAETFVLTAGHCLGKTNASTQTVTEEVQSAYPKEAMVPKKIGERVTYNNSRAYDTAEVKVENTGTWLLPDGSPTPKLVEWLETPLVTTVVGTAANSVGEESCLSGASSGTQPCGLILRTGVTYEDTGTLKVTENLIETSDTSAAGDSGSPVYAPYPSGGGVLIQGTHVGGGFSYLNRIGNIKAMENKIENLEPGEAVCTTVTTLKAKWTPLPVEGAGIPANTNVEKCEFAGTKATIEMSKVASETRATSIYVGYRKLTWFEPMSQIEAVFPGQTLVTR